MASEQSYTITLANNKKESRAFKHLASTLLGLYVPDAHSRKQILEALKVPIKYWRAFDLVYVPGSNVQQSTLSIDRVEDLILVEVKTTAKFLPNSPKGFFFGATQNEFELAELLGDRYKFCFVSLHPKSMTHVMLTLPELNGHIRVKRLQYQINL